MRKRDRITITMEMPERTRASRSSSNESIASAISMRIFTSTNRFFTSPLIRSGGTPLMKSTYCTFHITWMKWSQTASRNPTSLRSPQIGASAASTSSPSGRKWFKNWKDWVRSFCLLEVSVWEKVTFLSWIVWASEEKKLRFLSQVHGDWCQGHIFREGECISPLGFALLAFSLIHRVS